MRQYGVSFQTFMRDNWTTLLLWGREFQQSSKVQMARGLLAWDSGGGGGEVERESRVCNWPISPPHPIRNVIKYSLRVWSSVNGSLVMNIVPSYLILTPWCGWSANSKDQASIERSSQELQHLTPFACIRQISASGRSSIMLAGVWMLFALSTRRKTVIDNDTAACWKQVKNLFKP